MSTNNIQGWERDFSIEFVKLAGPVGEPKEWMSLDDSGVAKLKAFIASEIQKAEVRLLEVVESTMPQQDGNELTVFANKEQPFVYRADHPKGEFERKMFAMGYLQAKKHIAERIRDHIQQQDVPSNLSTNQSGE